jgi:hypothetical protein
MTIIERHNFDFVSNPRSSVKSVSKKRKAETELGGPRVTRGMAVPAMDVPQYHGGETPAPLSMSK